MSTDIKLDPVTHDIDLSKGIHINVEGAESLAQKLKVALLLRTTEWAPNLNKGIPYYQTILKGKNNKEFVDSFLKGYLIELEDVDKLTHYSSEIDNNRTLNVQIAATAAKTSAQIEVFF